MTRETFISRIEPFQAKLFRLALSLVQSRPEAEDIVQDVNVKLWNRRERLSLVESVEALAVTITKNLCIDRLRSYRNRKRQPHGLDQLTIVAAAGNPAERMEQRERVQRIHEIIAQLPGQQRLLMHLRDIAQHSYDEIEKMTGLSRNNIRVTLSRARKRVRDEYLTTQDDE